MHLRETFELEVRKRKGIAAIGSNPFLIVSRYSYLVGFLFQETYKQFDYIQ